MTHPDPDHKIGICHNPPGNPGHYNYQRVDEASITKDHGHDQDPGDIIPAFEGYAGKNLTPSNVALLGRECQAETTTTVTTIITTTTKPQGDPTTSTTLAGVTTTRPSTSTTATTLPTSSITTTTLASTTTLGAPTGTAALTAQSVATLPVTGTSPVLAGLGLGLIVVGAVIMKAVRQ